MKILYVAMKYDYGQPERGLSFEHTNFYESLNFMGHDILYFDFMSLMQAHGQDWMNRRLVEVVETEQPDLMFTALFKDEIRPELIQKISRETETVTLNWFCDDHWRFEDFTRFFAPSFNWVVTTAQSALPKYEQLGYSNVIKSQWACNHFSYRKLDIPLTYDVTFVGQPHGNRYQTLTSLQDAGFNVYVWGFGWSTGRLSQPDMINVFNQSRINLNLSNASVQTRDEADGAVCYGDQIKGRNFEIPGCGGLMLSGMADNLGDYFEIGKEIVCFQDARELIDRVGYLLSHEDERQAIAQAGYERTLNEHTYALRFNDIFRKIGLGSGSGGGGA